MNRQEFIEKLRISLNGKVPGEKIAELTGYYEGYISDEIAGGKTEEEVLAALGDPRLIARTIVTAEGNLEKETEHSSDPYGEEADEESPSVRMLPVKHPGLVAAIGIGIVILILILLFKALIVFAPFLFVLAIVYMVFRYLQK